MSPVTIIEDSGSPLFYTSLEYFRVYAPEYSSVSDQDVLSALLLAEEDIDSYAGFYLPDPETGRKFSFGDYDVGIQKRLQNATCAQAKYRLYMGPVFFTEQAQYAEVGGDIGASRADWYGPEMKKVFPQGMRRLTGRFK